MESMTTAAPATSFKITCSISDLNLALSIAGKAVPTRPSHPVLGNILLIADARSQSIKFRGFDLSMGIEASITAQVSESGSITLPIKTLSDIVSKLPDGEITMTHKPVEDDEDGAGLVTIRSATGRYKLRSLNAEDFPEFPVVDDASTVVLPAEIIGNGIGATLFACSDMETKQILTGVHITLSQQGIEMAATDGHRLAIFESTLESEVTERVEVTIPSRALKELERVLALVNRESTLAMSLSQSQVSFAIGDAYRVVCRVLEGAYPQYRKLLPVQFAGLFTVDRKAFQGSLGRVAVLADAKNNVVRCVTDGENSQIHLSVEAQDVGSGRESLGVTVSDEPPATIAFNTKYLGESIKHLSSGEITFHLNAPTQPVLVTPLSGEKITHLIMPVQVRD
jgi:DNA polymerase-3 subunit beta